MKYRYFCFDCSQGTNTARQALGDGRHHTPSIKNTKVEASEASDTPLCVHRHHDTEQQRSPSSGALEVTEERAAETSLPSSVLPGTGRHSRLCFHTFCAAATKPPMLVISKQNYAALFASPIQHVQLLPHPALLCTQLALLRGAPKPRLSALENL